MKKKILVFGLLLSLVIFGTTKAILAEDEAQSNSQQSSEVSANNNEENQDSSVSEVNSTTTEELEEVPLDVTGSEIKISPVYRGKVKPSLVITPAGIAKLTRAEVIEVDYNNKSGKVKVWGMEFRIDASNAYVIKRPIYRRILGKKNFEGIEGVPFVKSRIKVGDKLNIIGKVVDDSGYPILIKAKVIKNISRRQPKVIVLKEILKKKISAIGKKIKEEAKKEKIKKEVKKEIGKRIKNKASVGDIQKRIQEILERIRALQTQLGR